VLAAVVVIALPFVARHFDGTADEFSTQTVPILPTLGWAVVAALAAIVITHRVQIWFSADDGPVLAVAYDVLPLLLFLAPPIAIGAWASGHLLLAGAAATLIVYQAVLVIPRLVPSRLPPWAGSAPTFELVVANVFVDNPSPRQAADQLVACGADIIVIAEAKPAFMEHFDAAGGDRSHPYRVMDPADHSDYAVAIVARRPLLDGSEVLELGPLRLAVAQLDVGGVTTTVVALNPMSSFDPDGQTIWQEQIDELEKFVPTVDGPLVVAGDLNSTGFRPQFDELLRTGLTDGIDALGQAWRPSFSLRSVRQLSAVPAIVRLDQALLNDRVCALHVRNMEPCGSDHIPFTITLAVRTDDESP
jgi:endonuclease/exonuclease/phosphatase (EEP) superfamily protein YafD